MSAKKIFHQDLSDLNSVLWANGLYDRQDIESYTKFNRFGYKDPYNAPTGHKEYLFFTKPDLHLVHHETGELNRELINQPYFVELRERYPDVITQLQLNNGIRRDGPFMNLLSNSVINTLELPGISTETINTPANIYGTSYNYRTWGYKSDEKIDFSLEFEDTKYLEIYNLVKAYEEYERLKHLGLVTPPNITNVDAADGKCFSYYIQNKILHDQFSIYKFIVEDDGETIMYYAKLWGVFFKNVPRDSFSDMKDGALTYAVEFEAAFVDDMNPTILTDFNQIVRKYTTINSEADLLPVYNKDKNMIDGSWASMPIITKVNKEDNSKVWSAPNTMKHIYKLKWRR